MLSDAVGAKAHPRGRNKNFPIPPFCAPPHASAAKGVSPGRAGTQGRSEQGYLFCDASNPLVALLAVP